MRQVQWMAENQSKKRDNEYKSKKEKEQKITLCPHAYSFYNQSN